MACRPWMNSRYIAAVPGTLQRCAVCVCRCGEQLPARRSVPFANGIQRRSAYSPAVRKVKREQRPTTVNADQKSKEDQIARYELQLFIRDLCKAGRFSTGEGNIRNFIDELLSHGNDPFNAHLQTLQERYGLGEKDCMLVARTLFTNRKTLHTHYGIWMLHMLSRSGSNVATIFLVISALRSHKINGKALTQPSMQRPLAHLRAIAEKGVNLESMVLAGQVSRELGDIDGAIDIWNKAIPPALERAAQAARRGSDKDPEKEEFFLYELESPWHELADIHRERKEFGKARQAIDAGVRANDPVSHHYRAQVVKFEADGRYTSKWLYHATKAAASGHALAAHELGVFYATSGWKYIEDEPPDHIKPTPFDSFPPTTFASVKSLGWLEKTKMAIGLLPSKNNEDPTDIIFHSAALPATPAARMEMALAWYQVGISLKYAPSYLAAAQAILEKKLWVGSETPSAALKMTAARYKYASRAEYDADPDRYASPDYGGQEDPPNPHYNPDRAKFLIREVIFASLAFGFRQDFIRRSAIRHDRSVEAETTMRSFQDVTYDDLAGHPESVRSFFTFPEVRRMYMDDSTGIMYDQSQGIPDLLKEAYWVCEQQQWDIFDWDGVLLYRCGLKNAPTKAPKRSEIMASRIG